MNNMNSKSLKAALILSICFALAACASTPTSTVDRAKADKIERVANRLDSHIKN